MLFVVEWIDLLQLSALNLKASPAAPCARFAMQIFAFQISTFVYFKRFLIGGHRIMIVSTKHEFHRHFLIDGKAELGAVALQYVILARYRVRLIVH